MIRLGAGATAYAAFFNSTIAGIVQSFKYVFFSNRLGPHIAHYRVIHFADYWINGVLSHSGLQVCPRSQRIGSLPHTQGTGEQYWRLQFAKFIYLRQADEFAVPVSNIYACWNRARIQITRCRDNGGNTGAYVITLNNSGMPDPHTANVCDGVVLTGWEDSHYYANVSGPWSFVIGSLCCGS